MSDQSTPAGPQSGRLMDEQRAILVAVLALDTAIEGCQSQAECLEFRQAQQLLGSKVERLTGLERQDRERSAQLAAAANEIERLREELDAARSTLRESAAEIDPVLAAVSPVKEELARALAHVLDAGYGVVSLRFERGRVKRVAFEGSLVAVPPAPVPETA